MKKIKTGFDKSATRYPYTVHDLQKPQFYRRSMKRAQTALGSKRERKVGRILDMGCGTAYFTSLLPAFYSQVVGIDLSENMIQMAKKTLEFTRMRGKIQFIVADGEKLPFTGGTFDTVVCMDLLHHVPDVASIVREMTRVVRNGGKATAIEPNFLNPLYVILCFIASQETLSKFRTASPEFLKRLFIGYEMRDVTVKEIDYIPQLFLKLAPFPNILSRFVEYLETFFQRHSAFFFFLSSHFIIKGTK